MAWCRLPNAVTKTRTNEEGRNGLAGHLYMGGSDLIGGSLIGGGGSLVGGGDSGIGGVVLLLNLS